IEIKNIIKGPGKDRYAVIIDSRNSGELSNTFINIGCVKNKILPGKISVLTVEQSKGLEFDCVYVYDKYMTNNEKYISYTRALKELVIIPK
ncbi:MAG: ATP-binding domain-containing protein, partial [Sedimentibacter sp.]